MGFTKYVMVSYEVVVGEGREEALKGKTHQNTLELIFNPTDPNTNANSRLTDQEKRQVKVFSAN